MQHPQLAVLAEAKSPREAREQLLKLIDSYPVAHALAQFNHGHLPKAIAAESARFASLAVHLVESCPVSPELTVVLRKLLEAKDAGVRAGLQ